MSINSPNNLQKGDDMSPNRFCLDYIWSFYSRIDKSVSIGKQNVPLIRATVVNNEESVGSLTR